MQTEAMPTTLSALLDAGLQRQLTLVSAPAGFGKTTMLSTWAQSHSAGNLHVAWVTLDEGDNATRRFWDYVLTALDWCEPGTSVQALERLHAPGESPLEEVLTAVIAGPDQHRVPDRPNPGLTAE